MVLAAKLSCPLALALAVAADAPDRAPAVTRRSRGAAPAPTFTKDVLPILQKSCQGCHHPGTSAPMSLMTYQRSGPGPDRSSRRSRGARCRRGTSIAASANTRRPVAVRRRRSRRSRLGGWRRARRADGRCPAAARRSPLRSEWTYGEPDLDRPDGEGVHDSGRRPRLHPRRNRRSRAHRGPLREVGADHSRRAPRRAPRARLRRSARGHRHRGARPRHGIERRQHDGPDRVRRRQRRRRLPRRHRRRS